MLMLDLSIKEIRNEVQNYYPVSILSNLSIVYEKCLFNEMATHFDDILSNYQCGFRKEFSSQQCLIVLVKKWKKIRDNRGSFAAILTDLSKAFDCLLHNLVIAKLRVYRSDMASLKVIYNYLCGRKQKVKINDKYSS